MKMQHTTTLAYDEPLIREAAFCFWRRTVGWGFPLALVVLAVSLCVLLLGGNRSWIVGVEASALVVGIGFAVAIYVVHLRNAMTKFQGLASNKATFVAQDEGLSFSSELGATTLPWSAVMEVWRFERVWLLLFSKAQFTTLPLASVPLEMQSYLLQRVEASGGKIV